MSQWQEIVENILKEHNIVLDEDEILNNIENDDLEEDTVKQGNSWTNKGKEGTHGTFKTKKQVDDQRKAMFTNGYKG